MEWMIGWWITTILLKNVIYLQQDWSMSYRIRNIWRSRGVGLLIISIRYYRRSVRIKLLLKSGIFWFCWKLWKSWIWAIYYQSFWNAGKRIQQSQTWVWWYLTRPILYWLRIWINGVLWSNWMIYYLQKLKILVRQPKNVSNNQHFSFQAKILTIIRSKLDRPLNYHWI